MLSAFGPTKDASVRPFVRSAAVTAKTDADRITGEARSYSMAASGAIVAAGLISGWLYYWAGDLHRFTQWIAAYLWLYVALLGLCFISSYVVWKMPARGSRALTLTSTALIILFAMLFRAELIARRPFLSTDVYRYVWDGRVQAAGVNPYRYVPDAKELASLRDDQIFPNINRGDYALTPYPPAAQAVFLGVYLVKPSSVTAFKIAMSLFDLITMLGLAFVLARANLHPARVILFAWNPLLIFEGAHSGHIESIFIAFLALALLARTHKKIVLTGVTLGLATAVKFYPALLLPAFLFWNTESIAEAGRGVANKVTRAVRSLMTRRNLILIAAFIVTIILVYLPYLSVGTQVLGNLPNEFAEEGFTGTGSRYFILDLVRRAVPIPTLLFLLISALALLWLAFALLTREKRGPADVAAGCAALIGLYLLIVTPRYPWYYAWLLPWLCFVPRTAWLYMSGASVLLYLTWYKPLEFPGIPLWLGSLVFLPPLLVLAFYKCRPALLDD